MDRRAETKKKYKKIKSSLSLKLLSESQKREQSKQVTALTKYIIANLVFNLNLQVK